MYLNMRPAVPLNDLSCGYVGHSKLDGKFLKGILARGVKGANFFNLPFVKLGAWMPRAANVAVASFLLTVFVVVIASSQKQMLRIAASPVVALVEHAYSGRDWADFQDVGDPVRTMLFVPIEQPIAVLCAAGPIPARVLIADSYLWPESVLSRNRGVGAKVISNISIMSAFGDSIWLILFCDTGFCPATTMAEPIPIRPVIIAHLSPPLVLSIISDTERILDKNNKKGVA